MIQTPIIIPEPVKAQTTTTTHMITLRQMTSPAIFSSPPLYPSHRTLPLRQSSPCACSFHTSTTKFTTRRLSSLQSIKSASDSTTIVDDNSATTTSSSSSSASASASLFSEPAGDEAAAAKVGSRVRVKVPLKVYHIPKVPELDLKGLEGVLKQYVPVWKGKHISANLPYKIEFLEKVEGRDAPVKFFAHLKEDEFEYID